MNVWLLSRFMIGDLLTLTQRSNNGGATHKDMFYAGHRWDERTTEEEDMIQNTLNVAS